MLQLYSVTTLHRGARFHSAILFLLAALTHLAHPYQWPTHPSEGPELRLTPATVTDRVRQYGAVARARWKPDFERAGVAYPPAKLVLVGLKSERRLEVYASNGGTAPKFIRSMPILAASGTLGPKLRQGDMQVPEGLYRIEALNPNSAYHLSLRVNYPNAADRDQARKDGRTNLGGDIMIHGNRVSIGCIAMGDPGSEDLFVLAHDVSRTDRAGLGGISVILSPIDFRSTKFPSHLPPPPAWVTDRYQQINAALAALIR